jgi:RimJ/RimL family protein N-acetyltransferase
LETHSPVSEEERGPSYWLRDEVEVKEQAMLITQENQHLLEPHFPRRRSWEPSLEHGLVAVALKKGRAVSLCYAARLTLQAAEAGVETVEEARGHGYATAATALWASAVRKSGRLALYSTWWENQASQKVAHKLGAVRYGEDWWIA